MAVVVLQTAAGTPGNGATLTLTGHEATTLVVSTTADVVGLVVVAYGRHSVASSFVAFDLSAALQVPGVYIVDTRGLIEFQARVLAITAGAVTITADTFDPDLGGGPLAGQFPTALTAAGNFKVALQEAVVAIPLPVGAATEATQLLVKADDDALVASNAAIVTGVGTLDTDLLNVITRLTAAAASFVKKEDDASANADSGAAMLAVRKDTPANTSGTDGDYENPQMSAGRLWVSAVVTDVVPGVAATNLGKARDAASGATDTGVAAMAVRNDAPTSLGGADLRYVPLAADQYGRQKIADLAPATTATLSNTAANVANVTILAANTSRRGAMVFNDSVQVAYVKFGATASATSFTVKMDAGSYYEFPPPIYRGIVDALWAAADGTGAARVTEIT